MAVSDINGFLLTPKFRYFLNQMREKQPNHEFVTRWDFADRYATNGFTYNKGMFEPIYVFILEI